MITQTFDIKVTTGSGISPTDIEKSLKMYLLQIGYDYSSLKIEVEEYIAKDHPYKHKCGRCLREWKQIEGEPEKCPYCTELWQPNFYEENKGTWSGDE